MSRRGRPTEQVRKEGLERFDEFASIDSDRAPGPEVAAPETDNELFPAGTHVGTLHCNVVTPRCNAVTLQSNAVTQAETANHLVAPHERHELASADRLGPARQPKPGLGRDIALERDPAADVRAGSRSQLPPPGQRSSADALNHGLIQLG
jgi:hypothetical protein